MRYFEVLEGVPWPPPAIPISGPVSVSGQTVFTGKGLLMGYSVAGGVAAGSMDLYDGNDTTGQPLGSFDVAISSSWSPWFGDHGIYLERGLFVNVTAALARLVLFVAPLWRPGA